MLSFYQKLAEKLNNEGEVSSESTASEKAVTYSGSGNRVTPKQAIPPPAPAAEAAPEGTDPLTVDLFQSEERMVIFLQMSGVAPEAFEVNADEESNTVVIQAGQKRPDLPAHQPKEGGGEEKGRFVKQEIKWGTLYRKVYLPAPFDGSAAEAFLKRGVLVIVLPIKKPGTGKKLGVKEIIDEK
jgi:HSP20 family molecular chaperone IbpA